MNYLINTIPSDIKTEIRKIVIAFPFPELSMQKYMRGIIPSLYEFQSQGNCLEIEITGDLARFNSDGKSDKTGTSFTHSLNLELNNSTPEVQNELIRFLGRQVVVLLYTNTQKFQIGNYDQPLSISTSDDASSMAFRITGTTYFAAIRHNI